tara:strand:+ start:181 stop:408 length:228 start_codon:yes stop_codon:yes gene_type:complete
MGGIMEVKEFLNNPDRDEIARQLKKDKTPIQQLLYWMGGNVNINTLAFIDSHVKYNWPIDYFYELCAYSIKGGKE